MLANAAAHISNRGDETRERGALTLVRRFPGLDKKSRSLLHVHATTRVPSPFARTVAVRGAGFPDTNDADFVGFPKKQAREYRTLCATGWRRAVGLFVGSV